jgi:hypothetical protein
MSDVAKSTGEFIFVGETVPLKFTARRANENALSSATPARESW